MNRLAAAARQVQLLAEASDLPLRPEWLDDLAARWLSFSEGIERLGDLRSDLSETAPEPELDE